MKHVIFGASALLIFAAAPAAAETVRVSPEFHSLNGDSKNPKRRLEPYYKSSAVAPPVRFESRAHIDENGRVHLDCKELDNHGHGGDKDA